MKNSLCRIRIRDLTIDDAKNLYQIYSDKEAMKYRGSKPMKTIEDAKNYVIAQKLLKGDILTVRKGVESIKKNELIGSVMYRFNEENKNECEIGYSIGRKFWRKGFGNEIVNKMLEMLEINGEIENVIAWSNNENIASIKILEKNGFARVEQESNSSNNYLYRKEI